MIKNYDILIYCLLKVASHAPPLSMGLPCEPQEFMLPKQPLSHGPPRFYFPFLLPSHLCWLWLTQSYYGEEFNSCTGPNIQTQASASTTATGLWATTPSKQEYSSEPQDLKQVKAWQLSLLLSGLTLKSCCWPQNRFLMPATLFPTQATGQTETITSPRKTIQDLIKRRPQLSQSR